MAKSYTPEDLIKRYNNNTCTEEERAIVESWHLKELAESTFVPAGEKISAVKKRMRKMISDYSRINISIKKIWLI